MQYVQEKQQTLLYGRICLIFIILLLIVLFFLIGLKISGGSISSVNAAKPPNDLVYVYEKVERWREMIRKEEFLLESSNLDAPEGAYTSLISLYKKKMVNDIYQYNVMAIEANPSPSEVGLPESTRSGNRITLLVKGGAKRRPLSF